MAANIGEHQFVQTQESTVNGTVCVQSWLYHEMTWNGLMKWHLWRGGMTLH